MVTNCLVHRRIVFGVTALLMFSASLISSWFLGNKHEKILTVIITCPMSTFKSKHCRGKNDSDNIVKPSSPIKQQANISDDCDIIPPTPAKGTKKKRLKKKRVIRKKTEENIINIQVEESYLTTLNYDFARNCKIQNTRTGTFDFNKPYVYQSIEEVLGYTKNCFPKNNNLHTIGVYKFNSHDGHYLKCYLQSDIRIALDFTITSLIPNEDDLISVFGSVEFSKNVSILVVHFFRREVEIIVKSYMKNLRILKNFIPTEYFKTITSSSK